MTPRAAIVANLREIAALLNLQGANRYKARAFERGARALEVSKVPVEELVEGDRLDELPGIGRALARHIEELATTGRSELLDSLRGGLPSGVLELAQVPGIGLHSVRALHDELGIANVAELREAAREGRLREVKGFTAVREAKVLDAIERYEAAEPKLHLHTGLALARAMQEELTDAPGIAAVHLAGALRRYAELSPGVDLVVVAASLDQAIDAAVHMPRVATVEERGPASCRLRLADGTRVRVTACHPGDLAATLVERTSTPAHWEMLRRRAEERGVRLESLDDERALYARLGLPWTPPELRESAEVTAADDLVERGDLTGFVHCHTTWSDGKNTIEEMAHAAEALGASFLTITDHSASAHYAGGLDVDRLRRQWDEIAAVQERVRIRILRGTEADILADGALDWPDRVLEQLDVVIASIHQRYRQDEAKMTERVLRAMRHPIFKIWGHPLGRLVASRPPIPLRVEEVLDALAESRGAIEISGDPHRLDLEPRWAREARARSIPFVLSVDAHATNDFAFLEYAVGLARRAGIRRPEVLNTADASRFAERVRPLAEVRLRRR